MATIPYISERLDPRTVWVQWTLANGDDGAPYGHTPGADRSVQVTGTFGASGAVVVEGSNGATVAAAAYATLNDAQGSAISVTAAKIEQVVEFTRWVRPRVTVGDGTTALVVQMLVSA